MARAMLAAGETRRLERFAARGPSLGQCCGGVVHLAFELADRAHRAGAGARAAMKIAGAWSRWTARPTALFDARAQRDHRGRGFAGGARTLPDLPRPRHPYHARAGRPALAGR
jgi:xanthine/CO dehydrogenase XdhC/CoxF family maturation factor